MGDRALIHVKGSPCSTYLHWGGHEALDLLKKAVPRMRQGDDSYSQARLTGVIHEVSDGNTGLGLVDAPEDLDDATLKKYSPGDAGVIVYDCSTGKATLHAGYLEEEHGHEVEIGLPPI